NICKRNMAKILPINLYLPMPLFHCAIHRFLLIGSMPEYASYGLAMLSINPTCSRSKRMTRSETTLITSSVSADGRLGPT
ncbi:MAG: hypothetical protein ACE5HI_18525, partial [bacterium]